jgi:hypothetical protein
MPVVKLSITPIEGFPGNYQVVVSGSDFEPNQQVIWRLKGEDTFIDDNIIAPRGGGFVGPDGTFVFTDNAISGNLDEDWGEDEIYADVYYTGLGGSHHKSNTVSRHF